MELEYDNTVSSLGINFRLGRPPGLVHGKIGDAWLKNQTFNPTKAYVCWHLEPGIISKLKTLKKAVETFIVWCFYLWVFSQWIDYKSDLLLDEHVQICVFTERQPSWNYPRNTRAHQAAYCVVLNEVHLLAF